MRLLAHSLPVCGLLAAGAVLLMCAPFAQRAWATDQNQDNSTVENLLDQAKFQAYRLHTDADQMTILVRSQIGWQAKSDELARIRRHVNDLGKLIADLQSSRVDASPWQKEAVDEMVPDLRELAAITTSEIEFLNAHQDWPNGPQYTKWANESDSASGDLANLTAEAVKYGEDRSQLAMLSGDLGLPARSH